jgi:hypothetical protein
MIVQAKIQTIRELAEISGVPMKEIAAHLGLSVTMTHLKFKGTRAIFIDECGKIAKAMSHTGRLSISAEDVIKLIGRKNLKIRGYAS